MDTDLQKKASTDPSHIAVQGTSAGGGLGLALMLRIKKEGLARPAAIVSGSPWSDMSGTGDSYKTNEWLDNILVSYDGYLGRAATLSPTGMICRTLSYRRSTEISPACRPPC